MKMKKTVSAIAALAMSVSAFAGLGITANASQMNLTKFSFNESFDNAELTSGSLNTQGDVAGTLSNTNFKNEIITTTSWSSIGNSVIISDGALSAGSSGSGGFQGVSTKVSLVNPLTSTDTDNVTVSFKWYNVNILSNHRSFVALEDNNGNDVLNIQWDRTGTTMYINDKVITQSTGSGNTSASGNDDNLVNREADGNKWWSITATLDFNTHQILNFVMSRDNNAKSFNFESLDFVNTSASELSKIRLGTIKTSHNDQFEVYSSLDDFSASGYTNAYLTSFNVTDNTSSIPDATITLKGVVANYDEIEAVYNSETQMYEAYLPAGDVEYTVTKTDYDTVNGTATISAESDAENVIDITMSSNIEPEPITQNASLVNSYIDPDNNEAEVWAATLAGIEGTTLKTLQATALYGDSQTKSSEPVDITNITGSGSIYVAVVLENTQKIDDVTGVTVTLK